MDGIEPPESFNFPEQLAAFKWILNALVEARETKTLSEEAKKELDEMIFEMKQGKKMLVCMFGRSSLDFPFDQNQFEDLMLLIWLTYDTDAHFGNILGFENDDFTYGLKKIDNGLTFPTKNQYLRNPLAYTANGLNELSAEAQEKILKLDPQNLANILSKHGLDESIPAFFQRIDLLKTLVEKPHISLQEINANMEGLDYENDFYSNSYTTDSSTW